jgi:hypothetical protein
MRKMLLSATVCALALGAGSGSAEAAKGPKKPDTPFRIQVFTRSTVQDVVDSTNDVRKVIDDKKRDWFRLVENGEDADIVLEITGRDWTTDKALIVRGVVTTANLNRAGIVGQCIPGILDLGGPWKSAAANMAKRLETFCRETYADLAEARKKKLPSAASK